MLAFFSLIGCFTSEGWFISFFRVFMQGLIGKGFFLIPVALGFCALILVMFKDRPVKSRIICTLLLTIVLGAFIHLFTCTTEFTWSWKLPGELYRSGITPGVAGSGGMVSGLLAMAFESLFNRIGATIVLGLAFVFLLLAAFDITFVTVAEWYRSRPVYEPEIEDDEYSFSKRPVSDINEPVRDRTMPEHPVTMKGGRKINIDIPVDEPPRLSTNTVKKEPASFFDPTPGVELPDKKKLADIFIKEKPPAPPSAVPSSGLNTAREVREAKPAAPAPTIEEIADYELKNKAAKAAEAVEMKKAAEEVAHSIEKSLTVNEPVKYTYPPLELLTAGSAVNMTDGREEMVINAKRLAATIKSFGIPAEITNITRGPSVTRYEVELEQGVKLNKLTNLADDIALALGASGVRIAPIPDKISIVGIEVPNKLTNIVNLRDIIATEEFKNKSSKLTFAVGKDIGNSPIVGDIAKLPHLLIAGTTGSGKSVCMNSLILSLLYKATPEEVRLIMVDPKMIELGIYNGIPHLLIPVVTDPKKAAGALQWAVMEMLKRNGLIAEAGVRDLDSYNKAMAKVEGGQTLPRIVILIDELADLMLVAAKDVEESIVRIAQLGRASGMHLVVATQRPSADVITGLMKANIPSRIAFAVDSALNSRIILDTMGAEKLVGKGDMLYSPLGSGKPVRVQGTFVTDNEREDVINFVKEQGLARYSDEVMDEIERTSDKDSKNGGVSASSAGGDKAAQKDDDADELLNAAVDIIIESGQASVSMLQRRLKLGYSRAARLVDQMEERGIVGPFEGSKPRALLITREKWHEMQGIVTPEPVPEPAEEDGE
jgi:S-DNA-T family DNA segregation ATPase FtsK/SpoIIIE